MKTRWLMVMACLLITACDNSKTTTETESASVSETKSEAKSEVETSAPSPMSALEAVESEFDSAMEDFRKAYAAAAKDEREELVKEKLPKPEDYAERFLDVAKANPGTDMEFDALMWVARRTRGGDATQSAFDALFANYMDSEKLKDVCMSLGYGTASEATEKNLNTLIEKSPHKSVQGLATYALAMNLSSATSNKEKLQKDPDSLEYMDEDDREYLLTSFTPDPDKVEALYKTLMADFDDIKPRKGSPQTLGSIANEELFVIKSLSPGAVAMEIEGTDLEGKSFKLSDYRGKIVFLDFWGDW